jgi:hypothetical protein
MTLRRWALCVVVAGATLFAVGAVFHFTVMKLPGIQAAFNNKCLFRIWPGWTAIYMVIHPFWFGAVFATVYLVLLVRKGIEPGWRDGLIYGLGVFLVGSLPIYLLAYASFAVSRDVVVAWVAQSACQYLAAGVAVGIVARQLERWAS